MKHARLATVPAVVAALALALAGCAPAVPDPDSVATAPGTAAHPASSATATPLPCVDDPHCTNYRSTSATDNGSKVAWIAKRPLTAEFDLHGTKGLLVVSGPCATEDLPVTANGDILTVHVDRIITSASGCAVDEGQGFVDDVVASHSTTALIDPTTHTITVAAGAKSITFARV